MGFIERTPIRRRYDLGLKNFFRLYSPLATTWQIVNNSGVASPLLIAQGGEGLVTVEHDAMLWKRPEGEVRNMKKNGALDQQTIRQILDSGAVLEALRIGSKRAVRMNKLLGLPVATSRNGKVVWIPPEEIQVDDEGAEGQAAHVG